MNFCNINWIELKRETLSPHHAIGESDFCKFLATEFQKFLREPEITGSINFLNEGTYPSQSKLSSHM